MPHHCFVRLPWGESCFTAKGRKRMRNAQVGVIGGFDCHTDQHVAAALDPLGRLQGTKAFPTTHYPNGFQDYRVRLLLAAICRNLDVDAGNKSWAHRPGSSPGLSLIFRGTGDQQGPSLRYYRPSRANRSNSKGGPSGPPYSFSAPHLFSPSPSPSPNL